MFFVFKVRQRADPRTDNPSPLGAFGVYGKGWRLRTLPGLEKKTLAAKIYLVEEVGLRAGQRVEFDRIY